MVIEEVVYAGTKRKGEKVKAKAYSGLFDWFSGKKTPSKAKKESQAQEKKKGKKEKQPHHRHSTLTNILLFGGVALAALFLLAKGETHKKQAVATQ